MTEATNRRRIRPGFRRAAILIFILLIPIAAHTLWDYLEIRRLVREIEAIRAQGEPVTDQAAGRGYRRLTPEQALAGRYVMAASVLAYPAAEQHRDVVAPVLEYVAGHAPKGFDRAGVAAQLAAATAQAADALRLVDHAATLPFAGYPPGTEYSYRTAEAFELQQSVALRTASLSLAGEGNAAVASALTSVRTRAVQDLFPAPSYETPVILSFSTPSRDALRQLLEALQDQDQPKTITDQTIKDRAAFIDRIFGRVYGGDPQMPGVRRPTADGFLAVFWRPWFTRRFVESLRGWNELVAASRLPWPEKGTAMSATYARFARRGQPSPDVARSVWPSTWLPRDLKYALAVLPRRSHRDRLTLDRASAAAIAVVLYRIDHAGALPPKLEDCVPAYLPAVPEDPATGGSLLFRATLDAFTIYSVGRDQKDDGGDLTSQLQTVEERGWGQREVRGRDMGIRVLLNPPATSVLKETTR
jgi:hypothetical protein